MRNHRRVRHRLANRYCSPSSRGDKGATIVDAAESWEAKFSRATRERLTRPFASFRSTTECGQPTPGRLRVRRLGYED